jgi:hypothetical protein
MIRPAILLSCLASLLIGTPLRGQQALQPMGDEAFATLSRWFEYQATPPASRTDKLRST